ncbi:uncharacterized protein LOC106665698 isoform X2 [Cimex lectularius]|uniref:Uncharacterized protein n=1 Tax=Cimex lectularius TaxID=79782 RepID=A0A8I6RQ19_CIMLE|nr:uncharacterized protein LOC106665698 isoform X2 [Cimex lectularius]
MDVSWDDAAWWAEAHEEDTTRTFELESEDGTWVNGFLPPPPRPHFLDRDIPTDGLTTCDLCTWASSALRPTNNTLGDTIETLPWSVTLIVVSMLSALVGATLMVTLRHCFKINTTAEPRYVDGDVTNADRREVKDVDRDQDSRSGGVWCWVRRRPTLDSPSDIPATNHYTVDEAYSGVEALYAELDKPVYQNTGYVLDPDTSSPPSSAYYSDLSERTYETVGQSWEMSQHPMSRHRLAAIAETAPIHSDYV